MSELRAVLALSLALSGCASTSGHEWLNSPLDQQAQASAVSASQMDVAPDARPRLSHTVTLGESYTAEAHPAAQYAAPPVQVNVNTQVINNMGGYGYSYGYGYGASAYGYGSRATLAPVRTTTRSTESKVGADFPAPPDYGPRALR
ncbi:MAG TPA: hypothetical protein VNG33_11025 [Polyangiaceae bacterium]|nr:hypothetical protein [Polyangiaceae bacterium]